MTSKIVSIALAALFSASLASTSFAQTAGETNTAPGQRDSMKGGTGGSTMSAEKSKTKKSASKSKKSGGGNTGQGGTQNPPKGTL